MAQDIQEFIKIRKMDKIDVLGHSLGGKVGMKLALEAPHLVDSLIVVDMSPFSKRDPTQFLMFIKKMREAERKYHKKSDIRLFLTDVVHDPVVLDFLMTNLRKKFDPKIKTDRWIFTCNLKSLENDISGIMQDLDTRCKLQSDDSREARVIIDFRKNNSSEARV